MSDTLLDLEELLPQLGEAVRQRLLGDTLDSVTEKLRDAERQIDRLEAVLELAGETAFVSDPGQAKALQDLRGEANNLAKELQCAETSADLQDLPGSYQECTKSLANVERQLRTHWRRLAEQEFRPLISIGTLLERLGVAVDLGHRLVACGEEAVNVRDSIAAAELRDTIVALRAQRLNLDRERIAVTREPEVDEFLAALGNQQATLRLVTPRVREWLEKSGTLDRFDVRPT
ncbi:hypothetical protein CN311_15985 [Mesorhizobium sanjuanii]|uniref:Uncharacterized protein n=1 Tax=Mesorhizobium sanjuanii TaxID=2037900 RepID=A0A2A6FEL3_9HYPH|nr:hypothetical protein [Mesorhizobium sanjuanii]PDQ20116.1 hypothetical protein CN311_15985 [Mesorhizobium sanjuanii]